MEGAEQITAFPNAAHDDMADMNHAGKCRAAAGELADGGCLARPIVVHDDMTDMMAGPGEPADSHGLDGLPPFSGVVALDNAFPLI